MHLLINNLNISHIMKLLKTKIILKKIKKNTYRYIHFHAYKVYIDNKNRFMMSVNGAIEFLCILFLLFIRMIY